MPNLSVKEVPEVWADALRQRAARNHRSLQGELMHLIERAVQEMPEAPLPSATQADRADHAARTAVRSDMRLHLTSTLQGWKTVEQVVASLRTKYPHPIAQQASSIELIREDRDAR